MKYFKCNAMKRNLLFVIAVILPLTVISAQNTNREKLEAYRIGFFTKKLSLTSGEAEKFWPVYNDYQKQKNSLQQERRELIMNFNQNESTLSDKELTEIGDKLINTFSEESSIALSFHNKLKGVLPPAKVIRYYQAENQWRTQLLNELQENRQYQKPNQRRDPEQ
jgi:RNA polymerase-binding transcription factor DksA